MKLIANALMNERVYHDKLLWRLSFMFCRTDIALTTVFISFRIGLRGERENDVRPLTTSNLELVDK